MDGDFNGDGSVSIADFNLLAENFGQSLGNTISPSQSAAEFGAALVEVEASNPAFAAKLEGQVPEPASYVVLGAVVGLNITKRRKRSRANWSKGMATLHLALD